MRFLFRSNNLLPPCLPSFTFGIVEGFENLVEATSTKLKTQKYHAVVRACPVLYCRKMCQARCEIDEELTKNQKNGNGRAARKKATHSTSTPTITNTQGH